MLKPKKSHKKQINTIAADALDPYITMTSAAMVLMVQDKQIIVFLDERFQLPALFQLSEMKYIFIFS